MIAYAAAVVYALLAGLALPTQRALIMLSVGLAGILAYRQLRPGHALLLALVVVSLFDPFAVLGPGFWLSFGAGATEPPEVSARVRFLVSDVRVVRLEERFPLVLAPQHAMGLMATRDELDAFVATVRHHLAPGGTFIYDVLNPPRDAIIPNDDDDEPRAALEPRRPLFALHLRERKPPGGTAPIRRLRLRHFAPEELEDALTTGGLTLRERFGRFDGKPFELRDSRQIGVAGL
jgi:hypothetical protein